MTDPISFQQMCLLAKELLEATPTLMHDSVEWKESIKDRVTALHFPRPPSATVNRAMDAVEHAHRTRLKLDGLETPKRASARGGLFDPPTDRPRDRPWTPDQHRPLSGLRPESSSTPEGCTSIADLVTRLRAGLTSKPSSTT